MIISLRVATDFPHQNNGRTPRRMQGYLGSNNKLSTVGTKAFLSRAILITLLSELKCASLSSQVAVYQPRSFSQLSSL
jgi:hypothetical protein